MKSASEDDFTEFEFVDIEHSEDNDSVEPASPPRQPTVISDAKRIVEYFDPKPGHQPKRVFKQSTLTSDSSTHHISVSPSPRTLPLVEEPKEEETFAINKETVAINKDNTEGVSRNKAVASRDERKPKVLKQRPQGTVTLEGNDLYCCKKCGTHVSSESNVESRAFQVGHGHFAESKRGYLFTTATNLRALVPCHENFTTGRYKISYVECLKCETQLGWKYLDSESVVGKAKISKFCLRLSLLSYKS